MEGLPSGVEGNAVAIQACNLWRIYKVDGQEVPALRGVNLTLAAGKLIAIKGRSGSGKTTLLNCLGGLDRSTSGQVRIFGQDIGNLNDEQLTSWRRTQVGFIFQSFALLPTLSAFENVELVLRIAGVSSEERRKRTLTCLERVGLEHFRNHRSYELSGGQQQRVAIARALVNSPQLILADEATCELDSQTSREILTLFRQIVDQEKVTLLMASHDNLVDEYVDCIVKIRDGQIDPCDLVNGSRLA
jgi:ABC-type lipoprotein export system ATPase subunit